MTHKHYSKMQKTTKLKKSRAKYQCPPALSKIIETVNLVPPNAEMPDSNLFSEMFGKDTLQALKEINGKNFKNYVLSIFEKSLPTLPSIFQISFLNHVLSEPGANFGIGNKQMPKMSFGFNLSLAYMDFERLRKQLREIVNYFENGRKTGLNPIADNWKFEEDEKDFRFPPLYALVEVTGTMIQVKLSGLAEAIDGIDGNRLRSCEVCNRIYWANREDAATCSIRCANILRVRRYRSLTNEEKVERQVKRKANQELIKKGKAKSTKRSK